MPQPNAEQLAFKAEHDAIQSYEEGWDNWDGPEWPIGTIQCSIRMEIWTRTNLSSNLLPEIQWKDHSPCQSSNSTDKDSCPIGNHERESVNSDSS